MGVPNQFENILYRFAAKNLTRPAEAWAAGGAHNLFTVVSGKILLLSFTGEVTVNMPAGVNAIQASEDLGPTPMDDGLTDLNGVFAGTFYVVPGNVAVPMGILPAISPATMPWILFPCNILITSAAGTGTGFTTWSIRYEPLEVNTIVVVA